VDTSDDLNKPCTVWDRASLKVILKGFNRFNPELKYWTENIRRKKGSGVAVCAVVRKLVNIVYQLLTQKRDYTPRRIKINLSSRPV